MTTLSVCMITKNEENNIERCLNSISKIADEIIIVDTGSTDKTVELAQRFQKTKIYTYVWNNNFSDARNYSLSKATKKWVFFIDADEELNIADIPFLKKLIKKEPKEAISFRLINIVNNLECSNTYTVRFFKRRKDYKFEGKIHEQITPSIYKKNGPDCIKDTNIHLYHYGYDENTTDIKAKVARNLSILLSFDDADKDGFYYYNLATEYYRYEDYTMAIKYYSLAEVTPSFNETYKLNLVMYKARCFSFLNRLDLATQHLENYIKILPDYRDLYFYCGLCYIDMKKFNEANTKITKYKSIPRGIYPDECFEQKYNVDQLLEILESSQEGMYE